MSEAQDYKYIGQRTIRPDGYDKVTGRANFGSDLALPGMIWGSILRSPHAHANIKSIDTSKAEALPGVMSVATHQDFPHVSSEIFQAGEAPTDLVDLARNDLGRVARFDSIIVKEFMALEKFAKVQHLVSRVECDLASGKT